MNTRPANSTRARVAALTLFALTSAAATLLLAACDTPPHKADTNSTHYNYSYNK